MSDPAHRHGGPDAGWYIPDGHGWQRISDGEVSDHGDAAHFMTDPNRRYVTMADREQGCVPDLIVRAKDWPHGLRCGECARLLDEGDRYAERLMGMVGDTPMVKIVCCPCDETGSGEGRA